MGHMTRGGVEIPLLWGDKNVYNSGRDGRADPRHLFGLIFFGEGSCKQLRHFMYLRENGRILESGAIAPKNLDR